ncbi:hypothetical protein BS78_05G136400 [Paspalum vaginatum]|nr:hypothetical protein BS78_05G136400 [Paspalum vaginatum]
MTSPSVPASDLALRPPPSPAAATSARRAAGRLPRRRDSKRCAAGHLPLPPPRPRRAMQPAASPAAATSSALSPPTPVRCWWSVRRSGAGASPEGRIHHQRPDPPRPLSPAAPHRYDRRRGAAPAPAPAEPLRPRAPGSLPRREIARSIRPPSDSDKPLVLRQQCLLLLSPSLQGSDQSQKIAKYDQW